MFDTCTIYCNWIVYTSTYYYDGICEICGDGGIGGLEAHGGIGGHGGIGAIVLFLVIIPIGIVLGLSIYFLVIIVKFYKELDSGLVTGQRDGVVLQPLAPPSVTPGGVQVVYATPGAQNMTYPPQQQPPPTYSQLGYEPNTQGTKNPA